jgi:hypothetical protein
MIEMNPEDTMIYISGPMTGLPEFNYPAFNAAAASLRRGGFMVCNPAEFFGGKGDRTREEYMVESIRCLIACDAVVTLPNWDKSDGAVLEIEIAKQIGLPITDMTL